MYKIAIPTYKRPDTLKEKTLATLERENFPKDRIYIFFASVEEKKSYNLGDEYPHQIVGKLGLTHQRNFISAYFDYGQEIMFLDDDLKEIKSVAKDPEKAGKDFDNMFIDATVQEVAEEGFKQLRLNTCTLFGVYPVNNKGFMTIGSVTTDLKYIIGCCYGVINRPEILKFEVDESNGGAKEDFLRTCQVYHREGKVIRLNAYTALTNYYGEKGGLQSVEEFFGSRFDRDTISMNYICEKYPHLAKPSQNKDGHPEIKLKDTGVDPNQTSLF